MTDHKTDAILKKYTTIWKEYELMEDDGSPLNNFGKGLKKLFGKSRRGSGEDLTEQEIMSMVMRGMSMVCFRRAKRK